MARTLPEYVRSTLGNNYDGTTELAPFIEPANALTSRVATLAAAKGVTLSAQELELIERYLACHYYTLQDPLYQSKSTGQASGSWALRDYKQEAIDLDPSGALKDLLKGSRAQFEWLGKPPSQQLDYMKRN